MLTLTTTPNILVSELSDGNMRALDPADEQAAISNQSRLAGSLDLPPSRVARLRTVYGDRKNFTTYIKITEDDLKDFSILNPENDIPVTDGLITSCKNLGLLLPLADCLGLVVFDEKTSTLGLLHAGRHNIEQHGPEKFIHFFCTATGTTPENLKLFFSPCARDYEIFALNNQKLPEAALEQLSAAGINPAQLTDPALDTTSDPHFPSHSSGDPSRFALLTSL